MTRRRTMMVEAGAVVLLALAVFLGVGGSAPPPTPATTGNILANPGFEEQDRSWPRGWTLDDRMKRKGEVQLVRQPVHAGQWALRLRPNGANTLDVLGLSVGQGFDVGPLREKRLRVAAWLGAEGGATAVLVIWVVDRAGQPVRSLRLAQASGSAGLVPKEGMLEVPADPSAFLLVVNCQVEGTTGAAFFDDVVVEVSSQARAETSSGATGSLRAEVSVEAGQTVREIPRTLYGHNLQWIYGGNMIIDFRTGAFSPELTRLTRDLGVSLLRFPGGSFADYYHWRDGVGPPESRRETEHQPGEARSRHTFGTDEALAFAEMTGARLLITVNAHTGTAEEAAAWVAYVNRQGPARRVVHWEVGNEFYIKGNQPSDPAIPPGEYVNRLLRFAAAMKQADPRIKIHAIGGENFGRYPTNYYPGWNRDVLTRAGRAIDYLAVHNAYFPTMLEDRGEDVRTVYAAMLAAPVLIRANLETLSRQIETYAPGRGGDLKLAVTEWGPFFHLVPKSRWVDHVKTLGSGLFVASTLKAFIETPRVEIANAFKLNEPSFMGWIQPRDRAHLTLPAADGQYRPTAPYYAMQMYTRHFGSALVRSTVSSPTYDSQDVGWVEAVKGVPYLEVVSSRGADGRALYVMAINKHFDRPITARIRISGFKPDGRGTAWTLHGTGIDANTGTQLPRGVDWRRQAEAQPNPRFYQGKPEEVAVASTPLTGASADFEYTFLPHSVTSLELRGAGTAR